MAPAHDDRAARRRQSIPLQNLETPDDGGNYRYNDDRYEQLHGSDQTQLPGLSTYWGPYDAPAEAQRRPESPIDSPGFQAALPPDFQMMGNQQRHLSLSVDPLDTASPYVQPYVDDVPNGQYDEPDNVPLTSRAQPISGSLAAHNQESQPRFSFQTVSDVNDGAVRGTERRPSQYLEPRLAASNAGSYGLASAPSEQQRRGSHLTTTSGALLRAGSIVRAMSQRVVNISGESERVDHRLSRHDSRSSNRASNPDKAVSMLVDTAYHSQTALSPTEKPLEQTQYMPSIQPLTEARPIPLNSLKGRSLGALAPDNKLRLWLCDILLNPYTEALILLLIVLQTVLLTVESARNVFTEGNGRPERWGGQFTDWALLGLFIVFTLELFARIVVSGFILNAAEYSTIDRKKGIRTLVAERYRAVFQPHRQNSVKGHGQTSPNMPPIARSFTTLMQGQQAIPTTIKDQQQFQLARRAFLRHSFNRLDFVAVVSFWISFVLGITGLESKHHLYVFKMLSCLRILKLLALTHGTSIILRSLKKAAPLLVRVAFLIGFFWLLFAIIGMQSFKSSLSRQCVWLDPLDPENLDAAFTHEEGFCGGYLHNDTGRVMPWVRYEGNFSLNNLADGTSDGKGFICPRGSLCLEQDNPFNGTVSFDNIFHSLELVFVIMSANTFSDLMYYTMGSDYMQAALFFGAGIMIMTFWLTNLLVAVITSSFQVIREESKSSAFTADQDPSLHAHPDEPLRKASSLQRLYEKASLFWIAVIAFVLVAQACRSSTMSESREQIINIAQLVATLLLDIEILVRFAINWRVFHRSWQNLFDLLLAVVTTIILLPPIKDTRAYEWLTVFQILRVYRVVMVIPVTRTLILLVLGNAAGIANLMLFVFLMTLFVAIHAAQLFRGEIPLYEDGDLNRISFYTIYNSFLGTYQVLTSENWTGILYSVTSYTKGFGTAWIGAVFLIGWFILSFFILINMFIAVIQENFDVSEDEKRLEQVKAFLQKKELGSQASSNLALSTIFGFGRSRQRKDPLDYGPAMMEMLLKDTVVRDFLDDHMNGPQDGGGEIRAPQRSATYLLGGDVKPGTLSGVWGKLVQKVTGKNANPFYSNIRFEGANDTMDPRQMARHVVSATAARRRAQREYLAQHPMYNTSLYIFSPKNRIRRICQRLVGPARGVERFDGVEPNKLAWYSFSAFIYAAIVAMVVLACVTTPLFQKEYQQEHGSNTIHWYVWTDLAFAAVFTIETGIKIVADGLVWTPNAYLRSSWGIMDTIVLITLWINVATLIVNDGAISRAVGAFKALRALRLLNVSDSARNTFHSLIIVGWWKIFGAAFISISLLIPFAIYGLNLFNGLLVVCNDGSDDISLLNQCFGEFSSTPFSEDWPLLAPRVASDPYMNFNDFGSSMFTLFQIVSQEGWTDASFSVQAITGRGQQQQDLASEGNAVFFVIFNLMSTVFILTLFISIFMRNYTEQTGVAFLTAEQRSWLELRKLLRHISPSKSSYNASEKTWKKWCHKRAIEKRGKWYRCMTAVLVLHLLLLVVEYKDEPELWSTTRELIFLAFILLYGGNITIRIIGLGWSRFRKSSWDLYALITVSGAFIATLALLVVNSSGETVLQFHKFFLVAIVLQLIPRNDALDQLFKTAAASLTVIGSLLATWLVFFLVFAIAMTQAFSLTRFGPDEGSNINFRTVPKALILLFRMSVGEGWNAIMEDYANIEPPLCVDEENFFNSDCGSKAWARFLFVAWNIVSMYIFVNLFVSLIYESFSYVYQRSSGMAVVDREEIRRFKEAWRSVDPEGQGWISKDAFPRLLAELSGVFQMRVYDPEDSVRQILEDVRGNTSMARHSSIGAPGAVAPELDIDRLNKRLAQIDVIKIRQRRQRFRIFYDEVMVSADPDKGLSFTTVLMILAHYNIINDSKSLKLDEFLRRRARLQRVDDEVRRKTVQGFFDTVYWTRKFKKHLEKKRASRLAAIPQLDVPEILVDDRNPEGEHQGFKSQGSARTHLSVDVGEPFLGGGTMDAQQNLDSPDSVYQHPLSYPRTSTSTPAVGGGPGSRQRGTTSAFSFELYEPENEQPAPERNTQRGSALSPTLSSMLDESVWVDSLRRGATMRKSRQSRHDGSIMGAFSSETCTLSRRSSNASSSHHSSYSTSSRSSTTTTINSVIVQQPSIAGLQEERRSFGTGLEILEPRPIVYWGSVEERIESIRF
ncbi:Calcium-channel protein cch1 [Paramyrothecium foliicola]|nr:Calcium-channel protein cch1 [Paramyrothecium foliicola]